MFPLAVMWPLAKICGAALVLPRLIKPFPTPNPNVNSSLDSSIARFPFTKNLLASTSPLALMLLLAVMLPVNVNPSSPPSYLNFVFVPSLKVISPDASV